MMRALDQLRRLRRSRARSRRHSGMMSRIRFMNTSYGGCLDLTGRSSHPPAADTIVQAGKQVDHWSGQKEYAEATQAPGGGSKPEGAIEQLSGFCKVARLAEEAFPSPSFVVVQDRGREMPIRRRSHQGHRVGMAGSGQALRTGAKDELICSRFGVATDERERVGRNAGWFQRDLGCKESTADSPEVGDHVAGCAKSLR